MIEVFKLRIDVQLSQLSLSRILFVLFARTGVSGKKELKGGRSFDSLVNLIAKLGN